ncbi:hypothetical protein [Actinokineospora sp. UTMC 2448]|uniref:hypothetical protein n=1 Tax=Actinokineospora sp. UTMC 2448 TaxID=2268449 RepID=UPI002164220E|nr:hypothetical protein [Actinokineospora sp. UTMC 2448]UVS76410.1 hypothetical protein Actkin_00095 [Actinokineospora sp. UTMC 2448]
MTDLRALTDAFAELERRADAAVPVESRLRPSERPRSRLMPVAAGVAVLAGVAVAAAVLLPGRAAEPVAPAQAPTTTTTEAQAPAPLPASHEELSDRFRAVLAGSATFTVTDTGAAKTITAPDKSGGEPVVTDNGAAIVGTLTAGGVTGGFDLGMYRDAQAADVDWCASHEACAVTVLPDGSKLTMGEFHHGGATPEGVTYMALRVRPDGVVIDMHVSNAESPKGNSGLLGATPPLTRDQLREIISSDLW